ncbi:hypothetical protein D3C75_960330 [compost metagenome]
MSGEVKVASILAKSGCCHQNEEGDEHNRRTDTVIKQEAVGRFFPVNEPPDANEEEHGHQSAFEEQEEQE